MRIDILTLFPDMVSGILSESIIGRAQKAGILSVVTHQIRDHSHNKHRNVDDTPYGGGVGMVMAAPPVVACYRAARAEGACPGERCHTVYLSPRGRMFSQAVAAEYASSYDRLILLCGHYEGVDQRAIDAVADEELSIGDYVLTGGELPACIVVDAVARLLPGTLASPECYEGESIASGLLEYPQYTRPPVFEGAEVPSVLLSGNHAQIDAWRLERSLALTRERRPDLAAAWEEAHPPKQKKKKRQRTAAPVSADADAPDSATPACTAPSSPDHDEVPAAPPGVNIAMDTAVGTVTDTAAETTTDVAAESVKDIAAET